LSFEGRGLKLTARGLAAGVVAFALLAAGGAVAQRHGVEEVAADTNAAADGVRGDIADLQADVSALQMDVAALREDVGEALARSARTDAAIIRVEAWLSGRDGQPLDVARVPR